MKEIKQRKLELIEGEVAFLRRKGRSDKRVWSLLPISWLG
jgi:hypothetical protein